MPTNKVHVGRNVKRFREMLGIKQEVLAIDLGDDWNQQKVSLLEQKEIIDVGLLKQIATSLKVPVEALQNFDEERAVNIISNTFNDFHDIHDQSTGAHSHNPVFNINPVEKWLEAMEENKKLYERLLKEKNDTIKEKNDIIAALQAIVENMKR